MAVEASGTQTAVITTEHTLGTITTSGTFVLIVDTAAMVNGDVTELYVKTKILSGGTTRIIFSAVYANVQGVPIVVSIPVASDQEFVATLKQTAGTGRAYPWKIISL